MSLLSIWSLSNHFQTKVFPSIKSNKRIKIVSIISGSLSTILIQSLKEPIGIIWRVVVDNILWVVRVDLINVLSEFASWLCLYLLDLLESTGLHKGSLGLQVLRKDLGELSTNIGQDVVWSQLKEWLKGWQVGAHLDDVLEGLLGFILEILGALWEHVDGEESRWNVSFGEEFGVIWTVSTNLSERPGSSSLKVIFWLINEGILEWSNTL